jgi:predicted RNase H-like HicB family nuclease
MRVTAKTQRSGGWWAVEVPEIPGVFTQAKRLDQVEAMVRDAVAVMLDIDPETVVVTVDPILPEEWGDMIRVVGELTAQATGLQDSLWDFARRRSPPLFGDPQISPAY